MTRSELVRTVYARHDDSHKLNTAAVENVLGILAEVALLKPREFSEAWAELTKEALTRNTEEFKRNISRT